MAGALMISRWRRPDPFPFSDPLGVLASADHQSFRFQPRSAAEIPPVEALIRRSTPGHGADHQ